MPREAHHVGAQGRHVDREDPRCLRGVQKKEEAVLPGEAAHPFDVHRVPCQIGGVGADHGPGFRTQKAREGAVVQLSVFICRDEVHHGPLLLEAV